MTERFDDFDYKLMLNSLVGALENVCECDTLENAKMAASVGLVTYPVHEGFGQYIYKQLQDKEVELAALREQLCRLEEMVYAVDAGNTAREPVEADVLKTWFHYVQTGSRKLDGIGELAALRERVRELEAAYHGVLLGGNHLASYMLQFGMPSPGRYAKAEDVPSASMRNVWIAWRAIMDLSETLATAEGGE